MYITRSTKKLPVKVLSATDLTRKLPCHTVKKNLKKNQVPVSPINNGGENTLFCHPRALSALVLRNEKHHHKTTTTTTTTTKNTPQTATTNARVS